jgi:hypothetical protein
MFVSSVQMQERRKNITIELVQDGQPNAYLYGKKVKDRIHKASYYIRN